MTGSHANPEDLDLYALDALDGEEKQTLEAHLRACPACQQQLAAARQRTALIGLAAPPAAPRPQVKSSLMDKVRTEKQSGAVQYQEKTLGPALLVGVWAGYSFARLRNV
jgi:anti-sigma factor RsiW